MIINRIYYFYNNTLQVCVIEDHKLVRSFFLRLLRRIFYLLVIYYSNDIHKLPISTTRHIIFVVYTESKIIYYLF